MTGRVFSALALCLFVASLGMFVPLGIPAALAQDAGDCGCLEVTDPDFSPAVLWQGASPELSLHEIITLAAPVLWYSMDEPLFSKGDFPFPHPHPCDESADTSIVYYQLRKIQLRQNMDEVTLPPQDDRLFFEKTESFTVRYYFYYHEDIGLNPHTHDLEVAEFEISLDRTEAGCYQVRMTRVTAFAHGTDWYSNELRIVEGKEQGLRTPIVLFVEEGKHATCPDRNADGIYTPGYDINVRVNDAWGIRDVFGSGWLIAPGFNFAMFKPRWPRFALLPPETPNRCITHDYFSSLKKEFENNWHYELRPANRIEMCDDVPPSRDFLMSMMKDHSFGAGYEPDQYETGSLKALAEPLRGTKGKLPSINLRWDRALGLSFAGRGIPIESQYLIPRATWIFRDNEFSIEGMISSSASRFMGSYFSAGGAYELDRYRAPDGGIVTATDKNWNFVAEAGVKFRFRIKGKARVFLLGYEFGGVRLGIRTSGFDSLKNARFIAEIGAGVW